MDLDLNQDVQNVAELETMTETLCLTATHWNSCLALSSPGIPTHLACPMLFQNLTAPIQWHTTLSSHQQIQKTTSISCRSPTLPRQQHRRNHSGDLKRPQRKASKSHSMPRGGTGLTNLKSKLEDGTFFQLDQDEMCRTIERAFRKEMRYLKHAYATFYPSGCKPSSDAPSRIIYSKGFPEIDRTLNGILALRWIVLDDYDTFTNNQKSHKLTRRSFRDLRQFFSNALNRFEDHEALFALIVMQMTNDLGKSTKIVDDLMAVLDDESISGMNHDAVMDKVIDYADDLIPSLHSLDPYWMKMVKKLIKLSAEYNPAQLIQGECQSIVLEALRATKYDEFELDMKFMELFLDLSGAAGHVNHEGARTMTEPTFLGMMKTREISMEVATGDLSSVSAYNALLEFRLDLLGPVASSLDIADLTNLEHYTIARLLSMGRVVEAEVAESYVEVFRSLDSSTRQQLIDNLVLPQASVVSMDKTEMLCGIQPTYFPSLLALVIGSQEEKAVMLTALLTYLAKVLQAPLHQALSNSKGMSEKKGLDILIAERDVRNLAEQVKAGKTGFVYNKEYMPAVQIAKWRSEM